MKINLNKALVDLISGQDIEVETIEDSKTEFKEVFIAVEGSQLPVAKKVPVKIKEKLTLKTVILNALMAAYKDDEQIEAKEKVERYELALLIKNKDTIDLKSEQVTLIKKMVNKAYASALITGQACIMLEGGSNG